MIGDTRCLRNLEGSRWQQKVPTRPEQSLLQGMSELSRSRVSARPSLQGFAEKLMSGEPTERIKLQVLDWLLSWSFPGVRGLWASTRTNNPGKDGGCCSLANACPVKISRLASCGHPPYKRSEGCTPAVPRLPVRPKAWAVPCGWQGSEATATRQSEEHSRWRRYDTAKADEH